MELKFKIKGDKLYVGKVISVLSGNVNSYLCRFEIETDFDGLTWFGVFRQGETVLRQPIINGKCVIPSEVTRPEKPLFIGCCATNGDEDELIRVSTNWIKIDVETGAYSEAEFPEIPTPEFWETLALKTVPVIGENGNWFIYDMAGGRYDDSGLPSRGVQGEVGEKGEKGETGAAGYTPQKGVDYWTENDKKEMVESVLLSLPNGDEVSY